MLRKIISLTVSVSLIMSQPVFAQGIAELHIGQYLTQMPLVNMDTFRPLRLRYFSYDSLTDNFSLILDKGDVRELNDDALQASAKELLDYFRIGVSLPNDKFWVNLRPDAEYQIIDTELEKTDMGKVLLEADLQLKKDTARFTSPQTPEGKEYWEKLYKKAGELFGSENITIPTITRPWIVPAEVIIRETDNSAYIYKANLKVLLEEDYLSSQPSAITAGGSFASVQSYQQYNFKDERLKQLNHYSTQLIKESIIPKLTKEVNSARRYAALRQVFFSLVLSRWFKDRHKKSASRKPQAISSLEGKGDASYIELIDSGELNNLTSKEPWSKAVYFNEYKKSFEQGEYNIKEPVYTPYGQVIRSYVSGGIVINEILPSSAGSPAGDETFRNKGTFRSKVLTILSFLSLSTLAFIGQGNSMYLSPLPNMKIAEEQKNYNREQVKKELKNLLLTVGNRLSAADYKKLDDLVSRLNGGNEIKEIVSSIEEVVFYFQNQWVEVAEKKVGGNSDALEKVIFTLSGLRTRLQFDNGSSSIIQKEKKSSASIIPNELKVKFLEEIVRYENKTKALKQNYTIIDKAYDFMRSKLFGWVDPYDTFIEEIKQSYEGMKGAYSLDEWFDFTVKALSEHREDLKKIRRTIESTNMMIGFEMADEYVGFAAAYEALWRQLQPRSELMEAFKAELEDFLALVVREKVEELIANNSSFKDFFGMEEINYFLQNNNAAAAAARICFRMVLLIELNDRYYNEWNNKKKEVHGQSIDEMQRLNQGMKSFVEFYKADGDPFLADGITAHIERNNTSAALNSLVTRLEEFGRFREGLKGWENTRRLLEQPQMSSPVISQKTFDDSLDYTRKIIDAVTMYFSEFPFLHPSSTDVIMKAFFAELNALKDIPEPWQGLAILKRWLCYYGSLFAAAPFKAKVSQDPILWDRVLHFSEVYVVTLIDSIEEFEYEALDAAQWKNKAVESLSDFKQRVKNSGYQDPENVFARIETNIGKFSNAKEMAEIHKMVQELFIEIRSDYLKIVTDVDMKVKAYYYYAAVKSAYHQMHSLFWRIKSQMRYDEISPFIKHDSLREPLYRLIRDFSVLEPNEFISTMLGRLKTDVVNLDSFSKLRKWLEDYLTAFEESNKQKIKKNEGTAVVMVVEKDDIFLFHVVNTFLKWIENSKRMMAMDTAPQDVKEKPSVHLLLDMVIDFDESSMALLKKIEYLISQPEGTFAQDQVLFMEDIKTMMKKLRKATGGLGNLEEEQIRELFNKAVIPQIKDIRALCEERLKAAGFRDDTINDLSPSKGVEYGIIIGMESTLNDWIQGFTNFAGSSPLAEQVYLGPSLDSQSMDNNGVNKNRLGGIDFRQIRYLTQPMGSFQGLDFRLPLLSQRELESINIDEELAEIECLVKSRLDPSIDRLKRVLAAMYQKGVKQTAQNELILLIAEICRLKEDEDIETSEDFREMLLIADTGLYVKEGSYQYALN